MSLLRPNPERRSTAAYFILAVLLVAFAASLFYLTVRVRRPWFGVLAMGGHQWVTASTLKFAKNWMREGAVSLGFSLLENPRSVEFPTLRSRQPYPSYPPGAILPIYALAKFKGGNEPTPALVMDYNLANHLLIAVFLSLTALVFLAKLRLPPVTAFLFSLSPILLELLLPGPLYYHQNVYFADEAAILPFVLVVFLEVLLMGVHGKSRSRGLRVLQSLMLFYGVLTDWLFVFVALVLWGKRFADGQLGDQPRVMFRRSIRFCAPLLIGLFLFGLQILFLQEEFPLLGRFLFRVGYGPGGKFARQFFDTFWNGYVENTLGGPSAVTFLWTAVALLGAVWIFFGAIRRLKMPADIKEISGLMALLLLPCFLQVYFFRNHSAIHQFAALKFAVPLALAPFILLPLLLERWGGSVLLTQDSSVGRREKREFILALVMLAIAAPYALKAFQNFPAMFPTDDGSWIERAQFIGGATNYSDVVFSPSFAIPANPPQALSYSMKRVYRIHSVEDIKARVAALRQPFRIDVVVRNRAVNPPDLARLLSTATQVQVMGVYRLYRIDSSQLR